MATHAGMTTDEFDDDRDATGSPRRSIRASSGPTPSCVYQPMLELLALPARERLQDLHRLGRRRRVHAPVGRARLRHSARAGRRQQRQDEVRDCATASRCCCGCRKSTSSTTAGKPVGINQFIGRRPIAAFGNSDGDCRCCEWTAAGKGPRFDVASSTTPTLSASTPTTAIRKSGNSTRALDEALAKGWTVVDMKRDWKTIFPPSTESIAEPSEDIEAKYAYK